jgi:predicted metal-dependent HD superfamily phosphohydrolase
MVASDNEERSAAFAEQHLNRINYPTQKIERCRQHILATKTHDLTQDNDTNLFTDADLCILGQSWNIYASYMNNIRKEFDVYPDPIYKAGRRKVLEHFLRMEPLFKTPHFHELYEEKAKENIREEILLLQV